MKKLALLVLFAAVLAVPSIAAAKTLLPATMSGSATVNGITVGIGNAMEDGGQFSDFSGLENDKSGNCQDDGGTVTVNSTTFNVVCVHWVESSGCCSPGSQKMRFAYQVGPSNYAVIRITDNGGSPDTYAIGNTTSLTNAVSWVNLGASGSGHHTSSAWTFLNITSGDFVITGPQFS
jgi:hypothetical protein